MVLWDIEGNLLRQKIKAEINLEAQKDQKKIEKDKKVLENLEREIVISEQEINRTDIFLDIVDRLIKEEQK